MKLGILGTGMIVREFLPWLAGEDSPFTVQALCSTQRSAPAAAELCEQYISRSTPPITLSCCSGSMWSICRAEQPARPLRQGGP